MVPPAADSLPYRQLSGKDFMSMDTALLAQTAATTLVAAMATDAWGRVRATAAQILGRGHDAETEEAARQLGTSYLALPGSEDEARIHLLVTLRARLNAHPELGAPMAALIAELRPAMPAGPSVSQQVRVNRARNVTVAGRDIHR
jgi:hypothetical protein